jgi:uncharacterized protein (TIGR02453 family)
MPRTDAAQTRFEGFPPGGVDFFRALALKQDRDWFKAHKADYERLWVEPMQALLDELSAPLKASFPQVGRSPAKIFRIYRDTRFSKDKAPFKTSISAVVPLFPGGMMERSAFYFELGPTPFFASGRWMMEPLPLKRFRKAVADDKKGVPFAKLVQRATSAGFTVSSQQQLVRVPKPWDKEHPRADLLRHRAVRSRSPSCLKG